MDKIVEISVNQNEKFNLIPDDFPSPVHAGSISGAHPKVLMTEYEGKFYLTGATPPERYAR